MRLIALKVCGAIAVLVLMAMFGAIARRRSPSRHHGAHHTKAFAEYMWAAIPWLIFTAGVLPAVRLIVARSDEPHDTRTTTAVRIFDRIG